MIEECILDMKKSINIHAKLACSGNDIHILNILYDKYDIELDQRELEIFLSESIINGHLDITKWLYEHYCNMISGILIYNVLDLVSYQRNYLKLNKELIINYMKEAYNFFNDKIDLYFNFSSIDIYDY